MTDTTPQLTPEDTALIQDETERYTRCHENISEELKIKTHELDDNQNLARELTARMVAEQKDEEKQFIQSDENVAHGLVKLRLEEKKALLTLRDQPYFARVVYHERGRDIEFKLGLASFPPERIIDWRKAPISKLYYDYEEGDEYEDEIAGVERKGKIKIKRAYRGKNGKLTAIELKDRSYVFGRDEWHRQKKNQSVTFSIKDKEKIKELLAQSDANVFSRVAEDDGYLPQILSLLTPDQFRLISSDINKPVIIQGSAGTGKTTVALHRLAWLLFEENSTAKEENTLVLMFNKTLAAYVKNVLPDLNVNKVKIATFFDWAEDIIETTLGSRLPYDHDIPEAVARFKSHHETLALLEEYFDSRTQSDSPTRDLLEFYSSEFLDSQIPANAPGQLRAYLKRQTQNLVFDAYDLGYLLMLIHRKHGFYRARKFPPMLDHLLIDEAQDFTVIELKAILNALDDKNQLTIAGDLGQKILENRDFGTWEELLEELNLKGIDVLSLNVAFRSTYQIYELAEYVRDPNVKDEDLQLTGKFGPEPVLKRVNNFADAVAQTKAWIEDISNLNRNASGAIVCRTPQEARDVYHGLLKIGTRGIRIGDAQHFEFTPGITVTDVHQIKGLEFRNLQLFNPSVGNYSVNNPHDRNLLYVAITRAEERLDLVCFEDPSVMLPDFLNAEDLTKEIEEDENEQRRRGGLDDQPDETPWYEDEAKNKTEGRDDEIDEDF